MSDAVSRFDTAVGTSLPPVTRRIRVQALRSRTFSGYNPIHWDADSARSHGFRAPIVTGQLLTAFLQEMVVGFFGTDAFANATFECRYRAPGFLDDTIKTGGLVTARDLEPGGVRLTVEIWCENQHADRITTGVVTCLVPQRAAE